MIALVCWLGFCAFVSFGTALRYAGEGEDVGVAVASLMFFIHSAFFVFLLVRVLR